MKRFHPLLASTFSAFLTFSVASQSANTDENLATIAEQYRQLAEQGDMKAQSQLGYLYYVGEGVVQSYTEAVNWYRKAATQGDKDAQYNLAVAYAFGEGTEQDLAQAAMWYRRAAEQGHMISQYSLALSYLYGDGVEQDTSEAALWFTRAAEQGYTRAQVHLGSMYHTGDGVEQDYAQAIQWYRKAADRGDATAQYNLGSLYRSGKGVDQNLPQAIRWFRLAADQGYAAAQSELSSLERTSGRIAQAASPQIRPGSSDTATLPKVEETTHSTIEQANASLNTAVEKPEFEPEEDKPSLLSSILAKPAAKADSATDVLPTYKNPAAQMLGVTAPAEKEESTEQYAAITPAPEVDEPEANESEVNEDGVSSTENTANEKTGFFSSLFGKKKTAEPETKTLDSLASNDDVVEDVSVTETAPVASVESTTQSIETTANQVIAEESAVEQVALVEPEAEIVSENESAGISEKIVELESQQAEIVAAENIVEATAIEEEKTVALDTETKTPAPKKKGFFSRLFTSPEPKTNEVTTDNLSVANSESNSIVSADVAEDDEGIITEPETKPAIEAAPIVAVESVSLTSTEASVEIDKNESNVSIAETLAEEPVVEEDNAVGLEPEITPEPEKKGFFSRLFGSKKEAEVAEDTALENVEFDVTQKQTETESLVKDAEELAVATPKPAIATDASLEQQSITLFSEETDIDDAASSEEALAQTTDAALENSATDNKSPGFFSQLFGTPETTTTTTEGEKNTEADTEALLEDEIILADTATPADDSAAKLEQAHQALEAEEYIEAMSIFEPLAIAGNTDAQFQMASIYYLGSGVGQDFNRAFDWYRRAAEQGEADAQYSLGNMYLLGEGVTADNALAQQWYEKAAAQGHESAHNNLEKIKRLIAATSPDASSAPVVSSVEENIQETEITPVATVEEDTNSETQETKLSKEAEAPKEEKRGFLSRLFGSDKKPEEKTEEKIDEAIPLSVASLSNPEEIEEHNIAKDVAESVYTSASTEPAVQSSDDVISTEVISYAAGTEPANNALGFQPLESQSLPEANPPSDVEAIAVNTEESVNESVRPAKTQPEDFSFFDQLFSDEEVTRTELGLEEAVKRLVTDDEVTESIAENSITEPEPETTAVTVATPNESVVVTDEAEPELSSSAEIASDASIDTVEQDSDSAESTMTNLQTLAVQGDASAQYQLGNRYYAGTDVKQDYDQAFLWYRRAAQQGDMESQFKLGNMYLMGEGVSQSDIEAATWYKLAADQGHTSASHNYDNLQRILQIPGERIDATKEAVAPQLVQVDEEVEAPAEFVETAEDIYQNAMAYAFGDGHEKNSQKAFELFRSAAEQGHAPAQYRLALAYAYGEGTPVDQELAVDWYQKSAKQNYTIAQRNLAAMYLQGKGVSQDKIKALAWYDIVASKGNVMDIQRRDRLQSELDNSSLEASKQLSAKLLSEVSSIN